MNIFRRAELYLFIGLLSMPLALQGVTSSGGNTINNPLDNDDLIAFINSVIEAALMIGAVVAVMAVIFAGFMFVTAQGDEEKISTAKRTLLYAAIGIAILLGARLISDVITETVKSVDEAAR